MIPKTTSLPMKTNQLVSSFRFAVAFVATALITHASARTFDFKDPKGVNHVQFKLDAPLESITGTATGITGEVSFDPASPESTKGRITLATSSLAVGNPLMADHLRSDKWLDVAKHPTIVFEAVSLQNIRQQGAQVAGDIRGKLTVKGITKEVTVPVSLTYLADKLGARLGDPKVQGDLLVLRANFSINRSDYGIQAGEMTDKVAETINLSLSVAGAAPRT
jgi:polyisoprenoid-binding protein YceI